MCKFVLAMLSLALSCGGLLCLGGLLLGQRRRRVPAPTGLDWLALGKSRFVDIDGFRLRYVQRGEGPDLLLLHGIGASVVSFRYLLPLLARHYRVTALDLPGFGESSKLPEADYGLDAQTERVIHFLDRLGIGQTALLGASMGGAIALWLARLAPARFPRVVTLAPAADGSMLPRFPVMWMASLVSAVMGRWLAWLILSFNVRRRELVTAEHVAAYLRPYQQGDAAVRTFFAAIALLRDSRLPAELATVEVPVLILSAARDRLIPLRQSVALGAKLPLATLQTHLEAGHHLMEDAPGWVAQAALSFLRQPQPAAAPLSLAS